MKRKSFIDLAFLLPLIAPLRSIFKDDELLHFDMAELEPLLKNVTPGDQAKANLFRKNLAFDVQYVLERIKNFKDLEAIKSLALEADRKFYADNKMMAKEFNYQPITISALEGMRNFTVADVKDFDGMIKDIRVQLSSLQSSNQPYARETVNKLAGIGPQKYMRTTPTNVDETSKKEKTLLTGMKTQPTKERTLAKPFEEQPQHTQIKKAEEAQQCAKTWSMVGCIVALVIVAVIAVLIAVYSGGQNTVSVISVVGAILAAVTSTSQVISVTNNSVRIDNTTITLGNTKVDLGKTNLDSLLKCATSAASVTAAMSYFGQAAYPANPLAASFTVSLIGIVGKLPGFDACS